MVKKRFRVIPTSMKSKYSWGDKVPASGIYECSICSNYEAFKKGELFSQCQDCINSHTSEENRWFVTNEFLYFMSKNMNLEFDSVSSFQVKIADKITGWAGSMGFVYVHILWFALWVLANLGYLGSKYVFDPFPFGLLTMIVSLEAIFLATFIMISQNISSSKSELRAEHEYQVNLETEKNVAEMLAIIKDIRKETELKHETIEEIKETIDEIAEQNEQAEEDKKEIVETEELPTIIEEHEQKSFEEQEKLLDEAGIDMIQESAPIIEEKTEALEENIKKSVKKLKKTVTNIHKKIIAKPKNNNKNKKNNNKNKKNKKNNKNNKKKQSAKKQKNKTAKNSSKKKMLKKNT